MGDGNAGIIEITREWDPQRALLEGSPAPFCELPKRRYVLAAMDNRGMYGPRLDRWDKVAEWPLTIAAILFLIAYATQIIARPAGVVSVACEAILYITWTVFVVDYMTRLVITENRWRWFYRHLLDLTIVVLPMLRPLRLMRFLTVLALIGRNTGNMLRGLVAVFAVDTTLLTVLIASLTVYDAEFVIGDIDTFPDAVWWAFVTITTVGYGDFYPVTLTGRITAVGLMVGGLTLIGVVTATLASWIVERVADQNTKAVTATEAQVEQLRLEIIELKDRFKSLRPAADPTPSHAH